MDLNEQRKVAEAATPGPWTAETHFVYTDDNYHAVNSVESGDRSVISQLGCGCCDVGLEVSKPDAAFLTTFHPETVMALLSRLEQAEQAVARAREVAAGWATNDRPFREALLRALDGDTRG